MLAEALFSSNCRSKRCWQLLIAVGSSFKAKDQTLLYVFSYRVL